MDELELFGFIPNGGRIYCQLSSTLGSDPELLIRLCRPKSISTSAFHPGE